MSRWRVKVNGTSDGIVIGDSDTDTELTDVVR
jgi:hypothetical protein